MRAALLAGIVACLLPLFVAAQATAQEAHCRQFSWSWSTVGRDVDLFDEPLPVVASTQSLPKEGVFALRLAPAADVIYRVPPERGSDGGWGGTVTIETIPAGRYQIALSEKSWIDAIQDDKRLTAMASPAQGCRGVRQSIDVDVKGEPLTLQIGGAAVHRISIAVVRIWPFEWRW